MSTPARPSPTTELGSVGTMLLAEDLVRWSESLGSRRTSGLAVVTLVPVRLGIGPVR